MCILLDQFWFDSIDFILFWQSKEKLIFLSFFFPLFSRNYFNWKSCHLFQCQSLTLIAIFNIFLFQITMTFAFIKIHCFKVCKKNAFPVKNYEHSLELYYSWMYSLSKKSIFTIFFRLAKLTIIYHNVKLLHQPNFAWLLK